MSLIRWLIKHTLSAPLAFEIQQKLCNNYSGVTKEFSGIIDKSPIRILDIGCSTGTCAGNIIDMTANEYVGVDISEEYIRIAQQRYKDGSFRALDARQLPFEAGSFDVAMFIGVLHHMDDQLARDCLLSVSRVIKSSGKVIVAEPVFTQGKHLSNLLLSWDRGEFIRDDAGYKSLFGSYIVERHRYFRFSAHRFSSYVLAPKTAL